ncbi:hypothetical protein PHLCEN_2v207 [Hermanssonia centrifuga]|uniref:CBF1-interacting co-repressor CIR N-terminal domain-containing protein n=1 Tax=Hermanssonia centrifuga TaxID=98765 RepID=A0A2R6S6M8_9APHY|nr:hypothetical protein PHLCEN_2v207 [Hermanssonia centrifuga]
MGKLNIAHHKSYHPYRRDNIERVRRDEEEARSKEAAQDGKIMLADAEARIGLLRQRAGLSKPKRVNQDKLDDERIFGDGNQREPEAMAGPSTLTSNGHINLFQDLERQAMPIAIMTTMKDKTSAPTEQGIPLAPPEKDLKPWYSDRDHERNKEVDGDKGIRELARKSAHDPLTNINQQLSRRSSDPSSSSSFSRPQPSSRRPPARPPLATPTVREPPPPSTERLQRESSERQRALELIRRKKREMQGSETPSTVYGGMEGGYGDVYNRREVEEAHRYKDRDGGRDRRWEDYGRGDYRIGYNGGRR